MSFHLPLKSSAPAPQPWIILSWAELLCESQQCSSNWASGCQCKSSGDTVGSTSACAEGSPDTLLQDSWTDFKLRFFKAGTEAQILLCLFFYSQWKRRLTHTQKPYQFDCFFLALLKRSSHQDLGSVKLGRDLTRKQRNHCLKMQ